MNCVIFLSAGAIAVTVIIFIVKQFFDWKKEVETRIRFLENENSNKNAKIDLLEKIALRPFEKGEKK